MEIKMIGTYGTRTAYEGIKRAELKDRFFHDLWSGKATVEQLKARCLSDAERTLVDEAQALVERTDHDFLEGFKAGMTF